MNPTYSINTWSEHNASGETWYWEVWENYAPGSGKEDKSLISGIADSDAEADEMGRRWLDLHGLKSMKEW